MIRILMNALFFAIGFAVCRAWMASREQLTAYLAEAGWWGFLLFHLSALFVPVIVCIAAEAGIQRIEPPRMKPNRMNNTFACYWIGFIASAAVYSF